MGNKKYEKRRFSGFLAGMMILTELVGMAGITAAAETAVLGGGCGSAWERHTAENWSWNGTGATNSDWQEMEDEIETGGGSLATSANSKGSPVAGDLWERWNGISDEGCNQNSRC